MNLGKLLGAGKSIFGGSGKVSYREKKDVYLPKFNSAKNPFASKPSVAPVVPAEPAPAVDSAPVVPAVSVPAGVKKDLVPAASRSARAREWAGKLNPFRASQKVDAPAVRVIQAELSLDAVKVVHNDLADADIEVVPVKSRPIAPPEPPTLPPAREPWEYLGERLVKQS